MSTGDRSLMGAGERFCFGESVLLSPLLPPILRFLILFLALGLANGLSDSRSEALPCGFELSSNSLPETKAIDGPSFMLDALEDTSSGLVSNLLEDMCSLS